VKTSELNLTGLSTVDFVEPQNYANPIRGSRLKPTGLLTIRLQVILRCSKKVYLCWTFLS